MAKPAAYLNKRLVAVSELDITVHLLSEGSQYAKRKVTRLGGKSGPVGSQPRHILSDK